MLKFFLFKFLRTLLHFFALSQNSTLFLSSSCALFAENLRLRRIFFRHCIMRSTFELQLATAASHGSRLPLSQTGQTPTPSFIYIIAALSSPHCTRGIAHSSRLGGRHEKSIEDCSDRRGRADCAGACRAVFDPRQSVPAHH